MLEASRRDPPAQVPNCLPVDSAFRNAYNNTTMLQEHRDQKDTKRGLPIEQCLASLTV